MSKLKGEFTLFEALLPIAFLIVFLSTNVIVFGDSSLDGSNQIALILTGALAAVIAIRRGYEWKEVHEGITESINAAMPSILILLMIGAVSGSWLVSGVVPAMIYYGLQLINPGYFLAASCLVSAIVSIATGSSWTTAATVGVALMGIGNAMGVHEGMIAGAVLSGAYFGDKMSPLSDTTNLAPAMAGTDLVTHIRYMTLTTIPSMGITLVAFLILGLSLDNEMDAAYVQEVMAVINDKFNIHLGLFLVPIAVVILISQKVSALPALLIGTLLALVMALTFQQSVLVEVSSFDAVSWRSMFGGVMKSMYGHVSVHTSNDMVNELLSSGGMYGMLKTVWLILSAMIFGGIMEKTGLLKRIVQAIITKVSSTGSLVSSTAATCVFFNATASDQYLAIVVPARMYVDLYKENDLAPENLSRTLEDTGTVTSVLIPWNTCGAYHAGVLGVNTMMFAPYCFFNILSPIMTVLFAYLQIKIRRNSSRQED